MCLLGNDSYQNSEKTLYKGTLLLSQLQSYPVSFPDTSCEIFLTG